MIRFVQDMEGLPNVRYFPSQFWLLEFLKFKENSQARQLDYQLNLFLATEPYALQFQNDVVRNGDNVVTASRVPIPYVDVRYVTTRKV